MSDDKKVIYSMMGVGKIVPPNRHILRDISLSYFYGAKIGVLGLNGAGKSTLLRIMAGVDQDYLGETVLNSGYTVGLLEQEPRLDPDKTVREIVEEGVQEVVDALNEYEAINLKFAEPMSDDELNDLIEKQGKLQDKLEHLNAWDLDSRLELAMDALRCPPGDTPVSILSGGERRRAALVRLLLKQPDILLLDEPTNHLDAESVAWLERHLRDYAGTVIAVTHDRYFLDNVAGWILELDRGYGIPWKGNYSSWLEQKQQRLAQEQKQEAARQRTLERELEWVQMTPKGQRAKSKARVKAYQDLLHANQAESIKDLAQHVSKGYDDHLLYEDLTFDAPPGSIVGVIGANGSGKTTLFRMITEQEAPDGGTLRIGDTVEFDYVDQSRDTLDPEKTVWEEISDGEETLQLGDRRVNSRAYVARFNFTGSDQQKKVGDLSGGERNRVHLAKMLKSGANLLLLDEPTNDLDVITLSALEDALEHFAGSAIIISHDRWFLDRVATHILAMEGNSEVVWYPGNYSE
ncbi:MAG: energy-dependent translational throttle protein EttA [Chloroflexota bacterium]